MTFKQIKMVWGLAKPLLSAAGITKPTDVKKYIQPLLKTVEQLVKLEMAQATAQQDIARTLSELHKERTAVEKAYFQTHDIRTLLEKTLRDNG